MASESTRCNPCNSLFYGIKSVILYSLDHPKAAIAAIALTAIEQGSPATAVAATAGYAFYQYICYEQLKKSLFDWAGSDLNRQTAAKRILTCYSNEEKSLDLSHLHLTSLPKELLSTLSTLKTIKLIGNHFEKLPAPANHNLIVPLSNRVGVTYLKYSQVIRTLNIWLSDQEELDILPNKKVAALRILDLFEKQKEGLDLSDLKLRTLPVDTFHEMGDKNPIKIVNLDGNRITSLLSMRLGWGAISPMVSIRDNPIMLSNDQIGRLRSHAVTYYPMHCRTIHTGWPTPSQDVTLPLIEYLTTENVLFSWALNGGNPRMVGRRFQVALRFLKSFANQTDTLYLNAFNDRNAVRSTSDMLVHLIPMLHAEWPGVTFSNVREVVVDSLNEAFFLSNPDIRALCPSLARVNGRLLPGPFIGKAYTLEDQ